MAGLPPPWARAAHSFASELHSTAIFAAMEEFNVCMMPDVDLEEFISFLEHPFPTPLAPPAASTFAVSHLLQQQHAGKPCESVPHLEKLFAPAVVKQSSSGTAAVPSDANASVGGGSSYKSDSDEGDCFLELRRKRRHKAARPRPAADECCSDDDVFGAKGPVSHSTVEKQRRDRLNLLIDDLAEQVPASDTKYKADGGPGEGVSLALRCKAGPAGWCVILKDLIEAHHDNNQYCTI